MYVQEDPMYIKVGNFDQDTGSAPFFPRGGYSAPQTNTSSPLLSPGLKAAQMPVNNYAGMPDPFDSYMYQNQVQSWKREVGMTRRMRDDQLLADIARPCMCIRACNCRERHTSSPAGDKDPSAIPDAKQVPKPRFGQVKKIVFSMSDNSTDEHNNSSSLSEDESPEDSLGFDNFAFNRQVSAPPGILLPPRLLSRQDPFAMELEAEPAFDNFAFLRQTSAPPGLPTPNQETLSEITTLMICDIPCRRSIEELKEIIDQQGFAETFDLIYMPGRKGSRNKCSQNVGYAFVNFKTAHWANSFLKIFKDFEFPDTVSTKKSYAKPAHTQGFAANFAVHGRKGAVGSMLTFRDDDDVAQALKHASNAF